MMESGESSSVHIPANVQPTQSQKELLRLLWTLVGLIDEIIDVQQLPEFHTIIGQLCEKAPEAVQFLATTIQETKNSIGKSLQQNEVAVGKSNSHAKGKRASDMDRTYRPSHSVKVKATETNSPDDSGLPTNENEIQGDRSNEDTDARGGPCLDLDIDDITSQYGITGVNPEARKEGEVLFKPNRRQCSTEVEQISRREDTAVIEAPNETAVNQDMEGSIEATEVTSTSNVPEKKQPRSMPLYSPTPLARANIAPATPTKLKEGQPVSPQTEEVHREKIPTSFQSIASSPGSITGSSSAEVDSLKDMIVEAVRVIHQFSKYPQAVSQEVHSSILTTFRADHQEAQIPLSSNQWSDGSIWMKVLEMGSTESQKVTIFNLLGCMGASRWYNIQIGLFQEKFLTKKNKPVDRRGAAMLLLDKMQDSASLGRWISGVGTLALGEGGNRIDLLPESRNVDITKRERQQQRKRISVQLSRGHKLNTILVEELGFGILFSPKIWEYTKMSAEQLNVLIGDIQADSRKMKLLQILGQQLEQLIHEGRPDLHTFYDALTEEELVTGDEFRQLGVTFALDGDPLPEGMLKAEVDRLVEDVSTKVLRKRTLEDNDSIAINNGPELQCDIFDRLRPGKWFDAWTILAAMQISDKPSFVRYGYSVPLDEIARNGRAKSIQKPLAGWSRKIADFPRAEDGTRLVYFCPLNHGGTHFTLLEINERDEVIRHYDSMADQGIINHNSAPTRVERLVQKEFGHLGYAYSEAVTPQQKDDWSCGIRVVWNFRHLCNNLPIGGWHDVLDSERMKLDLVNGLRACVESDAMHMDKRRKTRSGKSSGVSEEAL